MSIVGLLGLLINLVALPFASARLTQNRTLLFGALLLVHLTTTFIYYQYALSSPADTRFYYYDPLRMRTWNFQPGTVFTIQLIDYIRSIIGGTYFDFFMIFQAFGFWGIIVLLRIFDELQMGLTSHNSTLINGLLFLPGIHFWSSSIGKDGPLFLTVTLTIWSTLQLRRRIYVFAAAIGLMALFRPHIALLAVVALAVAAFFDRRYSLLAKAALLIFAIGGAAMVASTIQSTFEVRVTDANSVSDFVTRRNEITQSLQGGTAVRDASFAFKVFSLLFRPLFYDAVGLFAFIASLENLVLLIIVGFLLAMPLRSMQLAKSVFPLRFAAIFGLLVTLALSFIYYNVGLGLRQKTMILPSLFVLFAAQWSLYQFRSRQRHALRTELKV